MQHPTHLCPFSKIKFNLYEAQSLTVSTLLHRPVLLSVHFINPMSVRYSTNWDRKGWPDSEIKMYYGCPWSKMKGDFGDPHVDFLNTTPFPENENKCWAKIHKSPKIRFLFVSVVKNASLNLHDLNFFFLKF